MKKFLLFVLGVFAIAVVGVAVTGDYNTINTANVSSYTNEIAQNEVGLIVYNETNENGVSDDELIVNDLTTNDITNNEVVTSENEIATVKNNSNKLATTPKSEFETKSETKKKTSSTSSTQKSKQTTKKKTTTTTKKTQGRTVYITPTGKRYHYSSSCGGKNSYSVTLQTAQSYGLTPCKKCAH